MATLPADIRPRVGHVVRLLASDRDGEVLAAVRALQRTLAGVGLDLNDLGDVIEHGSATATGAATPRTRPPVATAGPAWTPLSRLAVLGFLTRHLWHPSLTAWESDFARSIVDSLQDPQRRLSDRQAESINRIIAKVAGAKP